MYNWFFYRLYNYFQIKKNYDPLFHSVAVVAFAQVIHFCLLSLIIVKLFNFDLKFFGNEYSINKLIIFPFAFVWLYLLNNYYKNVINDKNFKSLKKNCFLNSTPVTPITPPTVPQFFK